MRWYAGAVPTTSPTADAWEVHVTLAATTAPHALTALAARLDGHVHVIHLLGGAAVAAHQPMVTFVARAEPDVAAADFAALRQHVVDACAATRCGPPARIKIEAPLSTACRVRYFESHVLLQASRATLDAATPAVDAIARAHAARWSRTDRAAATGRIARYLTRRDRGTVAQVQARHGAWLEALTHGLAPWPDVQLAKVRTEAVVWDGNEELDAGWG